MNIPPKQKLFHDVGRRFLRWTHFKRIVYAIIIESFDLQHITILQHPVHPAALRTALWENRSKSCFFAHPYRHRKSTILPKPTNWRIPISSQILSRATGHRRGLLAGLSHTKKIASPILLLSRPDLLSSAWFLWENKFCNRTPCLQRLQIHTPKPGAPSPRAQSLSLSNETRILSLTCGRTDRTYHTHRHHYGFKRIKRDIIALKYPVISQITSGKPCKSGLSDLYVIMASSHVRWGRRSCYRFFSPVQPENSSPNIPPTTCSIVAVTLPRSINDISKHPADKIQARRSARVHLHHENTAQSWKQWSKPETINNCLNCCGFECKRINFCSGCKRDGPR